MRKEKKGLKENSLDNIFANKPDFWRKISKLCFLPFADKGIHSTLTEMFFLYVCSRTLYLHWLSLRKKPLFYYTEEILSEKEKSSLDYIFLLFNVPFAFNSIKLFTSLRCNWKKQWEQTKQWSPFRQNRLLENNCFSFAYEEKNQRLSFLFKDIINSSTFLLIYLIVFFSVI